MRESEILTKNHLRHIAPVLLVNLHRDTFSVVPYTDGVLLSVNLHLNQVHGRVFLEVVSSIDKDLV
jgi:hypothetical protein